MDPALQYLEQCDLPVVVKASGLAAGKGVLICESMEDARDAVEDMLRRELWGERKGSGDRGISGRGGSIPALDLFRRKLYRHAHEPRP